MIGKIINASSTQFTFGCKVPRTEVPIFGSWVRTHIQYQNAIVYGLIYNIIIEDDGTTELLSVAEDARAEDIAWHRNRRVPIKSSVLSVAYRMPNRALQYGAPPQPPITLEEVEPCTEAEMIELTNQPHYLRTILDSRDAPSDELIVASTRLSADARPSARDPFILSTGRELTRLLARDGARLESILQRIVS